MTSLFLPKYKMVQLLSGAIRNSILVQISIIKEKVVSNLTFSSFLLAGEIQCVL